VAGEKARGKLHKPSPEQNPMLTGFAGDAPDAFDRETGSSVLERRARIDVCNLKRIFCFMKKGNWSRDT
jgi:hypothetical protein